MASTVQIKADEHRPQKPFQAEPSMELSSDDLNSRHVPAYVSGLQPHTTQSLYPNVMSFQDQYYFPPHPTGHASFPAMHNSVYSHNDSAQLGYGYSVLNSRNLSNMNHSQTIHSNNGMFPHVD